MKSVVICICGISLLFLTFSVADELTTSSEEDLRNGWYDDDIIRKIMQRVENETIDQVNNSDSFGEDLNLSNFIAQKKEDALSETADSAHEKIEREFGTLQSILNDTFELYDECMQMYNTSMRNAIESAENYLTGDDLLDAHQESKKVAITKFSSLPVIGGDRLVQPFRQKLKKSIEASYSHFSERNEEKRYKFIEMAVLKNIDVASDTKIMFPKRLAVEITNGDSYLTYNQLMILYSKAKGDILNQYDLNRVTGDDIPDFTRDQLDHDLDEYKLEVFELLVFYNEYLLFYSDSMLDLMAEPYYNETLFMTLHRQTMNSTLAMFLNNAKVQSGDLSTAFWKRLGHSIAEKLFKFKQEFEGKHKCYIERAELFNEKLFHTIRADFQKSTHELIETKSMIGAANFRELFLKFEENALIKYDDSVKGFGQLSDVSRGKLTKYLEEAYVTSIKVVQLYENCINLYADLMHESSYQMRPYIWDIETLAFDGLVDQANENQAIATLLEMHKKASNASMTQFSMENVCNCHMWDDFRQKLEHDLEEMLSILKKMLNTYVDCYSQYEGESKLTNLLTTINLAYAKSGYERDSAISQLHDQIVKKNKDQADIKRNCTFSSLADSYQQPGFIRAIFEMFLKKSDSKYILHTNSPANWFSANIQCLMQNARLASISSKEETDEIEKLIRDQGHEKSVFWISATNMGNTGDFYWLGYDKPFEFTNWGEKEPNNFEREEDCVQLFPYYNLKWNDCKCEYERFFICQHFETNLLD